MKKTFKLLILSIFICISVILIDFNDRYFLSNKNQEVEKEFHHNKTSEEIQNTYQKNLKNPDFIFPNQKVNKVKIYKNLPIISRLSVIILDNNQKNEVIELFNNPDNFDWSETTWSIRESKYIIRFFDIDNKEIGKLWLCIEKCNMVEVTPFTPNIKYGHLNKIGQEKINILLNGIYN